MPVDVSGTQLPADTLVVSRDCIACKAAKALLAPWIASGALRVLSAQELPGLMDPADLRAVLALRRPDGILPLPLWLRLRRDGRLAAAGRVQMSARFLDPDGNVVMPEGWEARPARPPFSRGGGEEP